MGRADAARGLFAAEHAASPIRAAQDCTAMLDGNCDVSHETQKHFDGLILRMDRLSSRKVAVHEILAQQSSKSI